MSTPYLYTESNSWGLQQTPDRAVASAPPLAEVAPAAPRAAIVSDRARLNPSIGDALQLPQFHVNHSRGIWVVVKIMAPFWEP